MLLKVNIMNIHSLKKMDVKGPGGPLMFPLLKQWLLGFPDKEVATNL